MMSNVEIQPRGSEEMHMKHSCPGRSSSRDPNVPTVFVVDADAPVRDALETLIRAAGFEPKSTSSAEEFLPVPRATSPSCLILETRLPGLSGLELQRLLSDHVEMPIIFMSASA